MRSQLIGTFFLVLLYVITTINGLDISNENIIYNKNQTISTSRTSLHSSNKQLVSSLSAEEMKDTTIFLQLMQKLSETQKNQLQTHAGSHTRIIWQLIIRPLLYVIKKYLQKCIREFIAAVLVSLLSEVLSMVLSGYAGEDAEPDPYNSVVVPEEEMLTPADFGLGSDLSELKEEYPPEADVNVLARKEAIEERKELEHQKKEDQDQDIERQAAESERTQGKSEDKSGKEGATKQGGVNTESSSLSSKEGQKDNIRRVRGAIPPIPECQGERERFLETNGRLSLSELSEACLLGIRRISSTSASTTNTNTKAGYDVFLSESETFSKKKINDNMSFLSEQEQEQERTKMGSTSKAKEKGKTRMKGGGILDTIMDPMVERIKVGLAPAILDQTSDLLEKELSVKLADSLRPHLNTTVHRGVSRSLTWTLTESLTHAVVALITPILRQGLTILPTETLTRTLVPVLTHSLASTITRSITRSPQSDYYCYYCRKSNTYCDLCRKQFIKDYYTDYYTYYYAKYFSKYYTHQYSTVYADIFAGWSLRNKYWIYEPQVQQEGS